MKELSSVTLSAERLAEIDAVRDEAIDTSEIGEAGETFFRSAHLSGSPPAPNRVVPTVSPPASPTNR